MTFEFHYGIETLTRGNVLRNQRKETREEFRTKKNVKRGNLDGYFVIEEKVVSVIF